MRDNPQPLLESLANSTLFAEFREAFTATTGLPLTLRPAEVWQPPLRGSVGESPFCARICAGGRFSSGCQEAQRRLSLRGRHGAATMTCWCGFATTVVPLTLDDQLVGFLQTGQVFCATPAPAQFEAVRRGLAQQGHPADSRALRRAYLNTRVMTTRRYRACVEMLVVFAQHLSLVGHQLVRHADAADPLPIRLAKEFIREHHDEPLRLPQVARAANSSTFHFCKHFRRVTGMHFSRFLCEVRLEKARNLLLNPDIHISDIAYTVGFQSLTHFNRVFKETTGMNPTEYRAQALAWKPDGEPARE